MIRLAKVIDINDDKDLGRIKVEVIPELQGLPKEKLPWALPKQDYDCSEDFKLDLPSVDSYILVEVNDTWTSFSYDGSRPYSEYNNNSSKAFTLVQKYGGDNFKPTYIDYSSFPEIAIFKEDSGKIGIVFGDNIWVVGEKIGSDWVFKIKNNKSLVEIKKDGIEMTQGSKSVKISATDVQINGDHLKVT